MNNIKNLDFDDLIFQSRKLTSSDVINGSYRKSTVTNSVMQPTAFYKPEDKLEGCDIEGFMKHHHDMIILTAIEDSKKSAASDVQNLYQGWARKEWSNAKAKLIERLGYRSYRAPLSTINGNTTNTNNAFPILPLSNNSTPNGTILQAHVDLFRKAIDRDVNSNCDLIYAMSEIRTGIYQNTNMSNEYNDISDINNYKNMLFLLSNMVGEHGNANTSIGFKPNIGCYAPLAFASINNIHNKQDYSVSSVKACQSNLTCGGKRYFEQLFMNYIQNLIDNSIQQGHIAQYPPSVPGQTNRRLLLMYLDIIGRSVGFAQGIYNYSNYRNNKSNNKYVPVSYCQAMHGEDASLVESIPLWIYIYYSIRIGDLNMALSELKSQQSVNNDPNIVAVYNVLFKLQQIETNHHNKNDLGSSINNDFNIMDVVTKCKETYDNLVDRIDVHRSSSGDDDYDNLDSYIVEPYALHMLRICSITDVGVASNNDNNNNINITNTVEDYMWTNVWYMYMSHYVTPTLRTQTSNGNRNTDTTTSSNSYNENDFYDTIESYGGQTYFDPNYDAPYTYVNVLLCCQRFGEAVLHLWICGKTFAAMQLLMSCVYYGILLPHTKLLYQVNKTTSGNTYQRALYDCTSISLFETWMKGLINSYPLEMVPYLVILQYTHGYMRYISNCSGNLKEYMKLETMKLANKCWCDYILKVVDLDTKGRHVNKNYNYIIQLVGDSVDDGNRDCRRSGRDGILDKYIQYYSNQHTIDELLVQAASILVAQSKSDSLNYVVLQGDNEENGYFLYMLSGKYVEIIEELCRHMCMILSDCVQIGSHSNATADNQLNVTISMLSKSDDNRTDNEFWLHKCHSFYKKYIEGGNGVVLKELNNTGNGMELAKTLECLLIIASIYDNYSHKQYNEVISITQQLHLLPNCDEEISMKAASYYELNRYIKYLVCDLCLINTISIKSLYDQYLMEKRGKSMFIGGIGSMNTRSTPGLSDDMIYNIQQRGKYIYMFIESIKARGLSKPDVVAHIHRIYHGMM